MASGMYMMWFMLKAQGKTFYERLAAPWGGKIAVCTGTRSAVQEAAHPNVCTSPPFGEVDCNAKITPGAAHVRCSDRRDGADPCGDVAIVSTASCASVRQATPFFATPHARDY